MQPIMSRQNVEKELQAGTLVLCVKLGTWDQPVEGDPRETIIITVSRLPHDGFVEILASVVNDECIKPTDRSNAMRREEVCASVIGWDGRRPKGVTPYGVPRHVIDNIPLWIQHAIAKKARQLFNERFSESKGLRCSQFFSDHIMLTEKETSGLLKCFEWDDVLYPDLQVNVRVLAHSEKEALKLVLEQDEGAFDEVFYRVPRIVGTAKVAILPPAGSSVAIAREDE